MEHRCTERPSREAIESVQRDGPERYLRRMYELLPYPMANHGIGWFGGLWDLHTIAPYLSSADAGTRMVALAAFSRLAGMQFGNEAAALRWWEENRATIPPNTLRRAKS
jgi:hypothetical protein